MVNCLADVCPKNVCPFVDTKKLADVWPNNLFPSVDMIGFVNLTNQEKMFCQTAAKQVLVK